MAALDGGLCSRCHNKHIYFICETDQDCTLEKNLIHEINSIKIKHDASIEKMEQVLRRLKKMFWKDKKMKMEIDDAIQDNRNS